MCDFQTFPPQFYISLILKGKDLVDAKPEILCVLFFVRNVVGFVRYLPACNNIVTAILKLRQKIQFLQ